MAATKNLKLVRVLSSLVQLKPTARNEIGSIRHASSVATAAAPSPELRGSGIEFYGLKDYEDYRRSLYGGITHKALLVDAVGTLVIPSQPMAQVSLSKPRSLTSLYCLCVLQCFVLQITMN